MATLPDRGPRGPESDRPSAPANDNGDPEPDPNRATLPDDEEAAPWPTGVEVGR